MRLSEARDRFISEFTFPVEHGTVVETLGDVEVDGPTNNPETVGEILGRVEEDSFYSADDLYDTIIGSVGSDYIGRRFYDDRGSNLDIDFEEVSL